MRALLTTYRSLFRRPAFFCAVVFTLTLGIGANSGIFSVVDTVLLKPLPYPNGDRLMALFESNLRKRLPHENLAPVRIEEWNRMNQSFTAISGAYTENNAETSGELPEMLVTARVAPRFFSVLGTSPALGRTFSPEEDLFNGPNAAVISERFWRRRFGADTAAIGRILRIGNSSYPLIGVMPDWVRFPASNVDVWVPAKLPPGVMRARTARWESAVARLKEGVTMQSAQADLSAIQARLASDFPLTDADWSSLVEPLKEETVGGMRRSLWILFGAVCFVLLITCANVACLVLVQAHRREREIALRFSLGARRYQVIREQLIEAFCLAIPGCLLGLAVSFGVTSMFRRAAAVLPRADEVHLDGRIVVFTFSISLLSAVLFGLIPALRSTNWAQAARTQMGGRHRIQRLLVSAQVALAIVLLVGSGLLIRSLARLGQVSLGFDPENVLAFRISASYGETNNRPQVAQRLNRTLETLQTIPGVTSAALSSGALPGGGQPYISQFHIAGQDTETESKKVFADEEVVTPDYFRLLRIPILSGSTCRINFDPKAQLTALVDRSFADRYFSGESPIGHYVSEVSYPTPLQIVGVTGDIRKHGFAHDPGPTVYWCGMPFNPGPDFLVKTPGDPLRVSEAVRQRIHAMDPNRAVYAVQRLSDYVSSTLTERRFQMVLLSSFAAMALLLAAVGLYGVTSFLVSLRTREIGLRAALGASPGRIFAQILREGALTTAMGVALGLAGAFVLTRFIANLLFGVAPTDPVTFVTVPLLLTCVSAAALLMPAHRATSIDPMEALRQE